MLLLIFVQGGASGPPPPVTTVDVALPQQQISDLDEFFAGIDGQEDIWLAPPEYPVHYQPLIGVAGLEEILGSWSSQLVSAPVPAPIPQPKKKHRKREEPKPIEQTVAVVVEPPAKTYHAQASAVLFEMGGEWLTRKSRDWHTIAHDADRLVAAGMDVVAAEEKVLMRGIGRTFKRS